jgi:hypothetical protein
MTRTSGPPHGGGARPHPHTSIGAPSTAADRLQALERTMEEATV